MKETPAYTEKKELRAKILLERDNLQVSYITEASELIIRSLINCEEYINASTLFTYVDFKNEVKTKNLIEYALATGKRVCVPLCQEKGEMLAVEIRSLDDLKIGTYGTLEPSKKTPLVSPEEIDLTIIPCLCADKNGYRLGYGGGFYDRFLSESQSTNILLCFSNFVYSKVPVESHDIKVDKLISNNKIYSFL